MLLHDAADVLAFLRKVELAQQPPEVVEHRADVALLAVAQAQALGELAREQARQAGAQELLLQLACVGLVLQVLEEQHGDRDVAHRVEAEHHDRARDGADAPAACRAEMRRVHHPQQLVGEAKVAQDQRRQRAHALGFARRDAVDRHHRFGQRGKVAAVLHAAHEEIHRAGLGFGPGAGILIGWPQPGLERGTELGGVGEARERVERGGAQRDRGEGLVDRRAARGQGHRRAAGALEDLLHAALAPERAAGEQFDEQHAGGEDVVARADLAALDVLGRHVARGAGEALAGARGLDAAGDAEVHHARVSGGVEQYVARLEVTMDHALGVRLGERGEHLQHALDRLAGGQGPAPVEQGGEALAGHVLEHQIGIAAVLAGLEHRHDAGVAQPAHRARLGEQRGVVVAGAGAEVERLERHLAFELRIPGEVHDALRAAAKLAADLEAADRARHRTPPAAVAEGECGNGATARAMPRIRGMIADLSSMDG